MPVWTTFSIRRYSRRKAEQTTQEDDGDNDKQKDEKGVGGEKVAPKKKPAGKIPDPSLTHV